MTDTLVLYGMLSPNVRKVVIMLEELSLPYDLRHVGVLEGEQFTPKFLAMNPLGKVPVLVDPCLPRPLIESGAILLHLAERHRAFLPAEGAPRQDVVEWLMIQMAHIGPMLGQLNHFQLLAQGSEPYALARYRAQAEKLYRLLDDRLAAREWIAGHAYSIADIAIHPWAHYLEQHGFAAPEYPALVRWRDAIDLRPAVIRVAQVWAGRFGDIAHASRRAATPEALDLFFGRTQGVPPVDYSLVTR